MSTELLMAVQSGQHGFFMPQREIGSLESALDLQPQDAVPPMVGLIELAGEAWPVYCLSDQAWALTSDVPRSRRVCLLLDDGHYRFGLVCDHIETLATPSLLYPVPTCMARPEALIAALVAQDEQTVGCMITTARLAAFCLRFVAQEDLVHG